MPKQAKPILDTQTGREYSSMYHAGQELAASIGGDPKNRLVWFAVQRAFPGRFQTKDLATGKWMPIFAASRKRTKKIAATKEPEAVLAQPAASAPVQVPAAIESPVAATRRTEAKATKTGKTTKGIRKAASTGKKMPRTRKAS
jgi:hypothetical protein